MLITNKTKFLTMLLLTANSLCATEVTIRNTTPFELYAGTYYKGKVIKKEISRTGDVHFIAPEESVSIKKPKFKFLYRRKLVLSLNKGDLQPNLTRDQLQILSRTNIGILKGKKFYIAITPDGRLACYNSFTWKKIKPIQEKLKKAGHKLSNALLTQLRKTFTHHPYHPKEATIRVGTDIGNEETEYLKKRLPLVKQALETMLGMELDEEEVPRIAFCGSGGGYRAMLATLGFIIGAENFGLVDSSTYLAGLSGSTWMIGPWITSELSLKQYKQQLIPRISKHIAQTSLDPKKDFKILLQKLLFKQPLSIVDIYGLLLGRTLFSGMVKNPNKVDLSSQVNKIKDGKNPYPIYTSVITKKPYEWMEYTPHEIGSDYLGGYIPAWAFGRKFRNETSKDFAPPQSLGFILGVCGSAFAVNGIEAFTHAKEKIHPKLLRNVLEQIVEKTNIETLRVLPAKVHNFTRGMLDLPRSQQKVLSLIDAGIDFNIPLPPLLRKPRKIDIIIILDSSADVSDGAFELKKALDYTERKEIKLPSINFDNIENKICSVFTDKDNPKIPTLIYMPLVKNKRYSDTFDPKENLKQGDYLSTFNLKYTKEQTEELTGLTKFNMEESRDIIIDTIKQVIENKRRLIKGGQNLFLT